MNFGQPPRIAERQTVRTAKKAVEVPETGVAETPAAETEA